jgi:hypothetical protein
MESPATVLARWRAANRAASDAESALFEATMKYTAGRGPRPTDEEMDRCKQLRALSADLFKQAMSELDAKSYTPYQPRPRSQDQHGQH